MKLCVIVKTEKYMYIIFINYVYIFTYTPNIFSHFLEGKTSFAQGIVWTAGFGSVNPEIVPEFVRL